MVEAFPRMRHVFFCSKVGLLDLVAGDFWCVIIFFCWVGLGEKRRTQLVENEAIVWPH